MKLSAAWYNPETDRYRMEYTYTNGGETYVVTGWAEYYSGKTSIPSVLPVTHPRKARKLERRIT